MPCLDTFLTALYVLADDFCNSRDLPTRPGPAPALAPAEVLTLALLSRLPRFASERDFYRFAEQNLRGAFPTLPDRSQFNRALCAADALMIAMLHHIADALRGPSHGRPSAAYEALDTTAVPVRNAKRRGSGHLAGQADIGHSTRLGWYEGFSLLVAADPAGVVTGYALGSASTKEQTLCTSFLGARALYEVNPERAAVRGVACAGTSFSGGSYLGDKGFAGEALHAEWYERFGAAVATPPKRSDKKRVWPKGLRRQMVSLRQIVETVIGHVQAYASVQKDRPHSFAGLWARVATSLTLHNARIWINRALGRPDMAFADQVGW